MAWITNIFLFVNIVKGKHLCIDCCPSFINFIIFFRVLQLMNLTDSRLAQGGCEKLELAMLSFFEQFRKIYVGDQVC